MAKTDWFDDRLQRKILEKLAQCYPYQNHFTEIMHHVSYAFENRERLYRNICYLNGLGLLQMFHCARYYVSNNIFLEQNYQYSYCITSIGISNVEYPAETLYQTVAKDTKVHIL